MHILPDTDLVNLCNEGNKHAWEELIHRYERLIFYSAIRAGADPGEAEEIFQNVSLILLKNLKRIRKSLSLGAWLITVTRNECKKYWNSKQKDDKIETAVQDQGISDEISPERLAARAEDERAVRQAVDLVPEPCRKLLLLLYFQEEKLSYRQIASKMHMPINSIGPTRRRCLEKLKNILLDLGWAESE